MLRYDLLNLPIVSAVCYDIDGGYQGEYISIIISMQSRLVIMKDCMYRKDYVDKLYNLENDKKIIHSQQL